MKTKTRIVLGVAFLLILTGALVLFTPFRKISKLENKTVASLASAKFSLVDVNKATIKELEKLPGVGPTKARAIVEYRKKNGAFKQIQDLLKVSGIGKETLKKFSKMVTGFLLLNQPLKSTNLVDINKAAIDELEKLPSIGPTKAKEIVEYRNAHGPFSNIEELLKVKGIGPKTLNKIKRLVKIGKS